MKTPGPNPALPARSRQQGVVLFFALIALVILLIGGIVVMRSVNASLYDAGNLAFRRDLTTQSDAAIAPAIKAITAAGTGAAGAIANLQTSQAALNYSAVLLPADAQGIPKALWTDSDFGAVANAGNDIQGPAGSRVTIRYLIERMCDTEGPVNPQHCVQTLGNASGGGTASPVPPPAPPGSVIYRLSTRVTGPRDTQAFFRTMFTGPG